jgi:ABC-2 type transport system ATP-binding protein
VNLNDLQFAWFEEKLKGLSGSVDSVLSTGSQICMSLGDDDAVAMPNIQRGGDAYALDASIPQFNAVLGLGGALLGSGEREALLATLPLYTAPAGGAVLAGIPMLDIEVAGLSGFELADCPAPIIQTGCDPILLLGMGHRKVGSARWDLVDDQLTPIRGFGSFAMEMTGVAERLNEGDELALLIYGFHAHYPVTWSRDVFVPAVNFSGSVELPIVADTLLTAVQ